MSIPKTETKVLIQALRILARDIQSGDGVANAAIAEAADRLEEMDAAPQAENKQLREAVIRALPAIREYVDFHGPCLDCHPDDREGEDQELQWQIDDGMSKAMSGIEAALKGQRPEDPERWIPVAERFPTKEEAQRNLLVYTSSGSVYCERFREGMFKFGVITHWKVLRAPEDADDKP